MANNKTVTKSRELRVGELADVVGVGKSHMSLILGGKRMPSAQVLKKIADAMNVSMDEMYEKLTAA